jgi:hypothetical protein
MVSGYWTWWVLPSWPHNAAATYTDSAALLLGFSIDEKTLRHFDIYYLMTSFHSVLSLYAAPAPIRFGLDVPRQPSSPSIQLMALRKAQKHYHYRHAGYLATFLPRAQPTHRPQLRLFAERRCLHSTFSRWLRHVWASLGLWLGQHFAPLSSSSSLITNIDLIDAVTSRAFFFACCLIFVFIVVCLVSSLESLIIWPAHILSEVSTIRLFSR